MAVNLSPVGGVAAQFFTNTGAVLTGGKLYTYAAGTTTPQTTYTSSNGLTPWTNPIVLDAAGRVPSGGEIWLTDGVAYKFVLKDSTDVLIATYDNITGINSNAISFTNSQEIQTATAGQTVFTLTTMQYQVATNSLSVFVDGVNQYGPGAQYAYTETSSTSVTFTNGLHVGAVVKFTTSQQQGAGLTNASQITYNPAGTGAVATNVQAKLRQYVSVKDFGAVGNGVADDTAAIQAAINSAVTLNNSVYFPSGTYQITSTISLPNNIALVGETERNVNVGGNVYGVMLRTSNNIVMMQTSAVLPDLTNGIRIENISFYGNGSTGTALVIGVDNVSSISFGIVLKSISTQALQNGIKLCNPGPMTYLENLTLIGTDTAGSYGLWFRRGQIAECHSIKIENFANCYFLQWCQDITFFNSTASFNVPSIANGNNLVQIYGGYHNSFYDCTFENLSTSSGAVVEVAIFEYFADPSKSTNNAFHKCHWNGIGTSACRLKIGSSIGPATNKTILTDCTSRKWGGLTVDLNLENANGTVLTQCYSITNYDGSDSTTWTTTGTDTAFQVYDINGITFTQGSSTFTSSIGGGGSGTGVAYSAQGGWSYKLDKTVTVNVRLALSNKGSNTGGVAIYGLPFTAFGGSSDFYPVTIVASNLNSGITVPILGGIIGASTQINLYKWVSGSITPLLDTDLTNTSSFLVSATYITA